jgi:flagellar hook-associated protein 3 FlgL
MRVTTGMLINTVIHDIEDRLAQMAKRQEELSSGRRLNRPSDDPGGVVSALRLRAKLAEDVQYKQNMDDAVAWLNTTEAALREAISTLQRVREIAVAGANQTLPAESMEALAKEVAQLKSHLGGVANTDSGGRYIFAGVKTLTPPYDPNTGVWNGTGDIFTYEIAPGVTVPVNIDGRAVFDSATLPKVFQVLDDLITDLQNGDAGSISNTRIGEIDQNIDNILAVLAEVGARINRLEMAKNRMETTDVDLTDLLAQVEDADMARALIDLKSQENVYRATLAVGARIIQPSLVDFLR